MIIKPRRLTGKRRTPYWGVLAPETAFGTIRQPDTLIKLLQAEHPIGMVIESTATREKDPHRPPETRFI